MHDNVLICDCMIPIIGYLLFSLPLLMFYIKSIPVTSLFLSVIQERSVIFLITAAAGKFVTLVHVDQMMNWELSRPHASPQHPQLTGDDHVASARLDREMCLCVSSSAWPCLSVSWLHFLSHLPRGTSALDWLQHLSSQFQNIMGRKKIQIQRITDERNKQVRLSYLFVCSFLCDFLKSSQQTGDWNSLHEYEFFIGFLNKARCCSLNIKLQS